MRSWRLRPERSILVASALVTLPGSAEPGRIGFTSDASADVRLGLVFFTGASKSSRYDRSDLSEMYRPNAARHSSAHARVTRYSCFLIIAWHARRSASLKYPF